jgi:exonuclease VII large subunit
VPVTARLSRRFYDAIGDDAANDLVNWMNAVDLTYRNELLQHNEANFSRFSATLEARVASLREEMDRRFDALREEMDRRFDRVEARLDKIEQRLDAMDFKAFEARIDRKFDQFEARILKWMLVFWTTTMLGAAGMIFAALQLR